MDERQNEDEAVSRVTAMHLRRLLTHNCETQDAERQYMRLAADRFGWAWNDNADCPQFLLDMDNK